MKLVKIEAIRSVLIAATLCTTSIVQSADSSVADEYLKVYADSEAALDELGKFYSKDAVFTDPTSEKWGEDGWNVKGREEILAKMKAFTSQFDQFLIAYNLDVKYTSSGYTVYTGKVKYSKVKDGVVESTCSPVTTIISVRDGKVVEHRDYIDYDTWESSTKSGDQDC